MPEESKICLSHLLVPKQEIISQEEVEKVLAQFKISKKDLPRIFTVDPVAKALGANDGDVLRIHRKDLTGENIYYRVVVTK